MKTIRVQFFLGCYVINIESLLKSQNTVNVTSNVKLIASFVIRTLFCHCVAHARTINSNEKIA